MRRKRAIILFACQSFAWFTSKDEVTNRLAASADYGVRIVESFAPPANWIPGQTINKDVYAVNTGSIPAFVKETVSSTLSITKEVPVTVVMKTDDGSTDSIDESNQINTLSYKDGDTDKAVTLSDCIELDYDEVYVMEAGSYLAYAPKGATEKPGRIVVAYDDKYDPDKPTYQYVAKYDGKTYYLTKEQYETAFPSVGDPVQPASITDATAWNTLKSTSQWTKVEAPASKTDFTPDVEGVYVFRRIIDVAQNNTEQFDYDAYYYKDGHYYKVKNLTVTPDDVIDLSDDGKETDGQLSAATFKLATDVKEVIVPKLTYDQANNRLIATYGDYKDDAKNKIIDDGTANTDVLDELKELAKELDNKEHDLIAARAALDAAMAESAVSDANIATDRAHIQALENEIAEVNARIAQLDELIGDSDPSNLAALAKRVDDLEKTLTTTNDETDDLKIVQSKLTALYGAKNKDKFTRKSTVANATKNAKNGITFEENRVTDNTDATPANYQADDGCAYDNLLDAQRAYDIAKDAYGANVYEAYLRELRTAFNANADVQNATTLDEAVAALTYDELTGPNAPAFTAGTELHNLNQKVVDLLEAQLEYDQAYKAAKEAVSTFLDKLDQLGNGKQDSGTDKTETVGGKTFTYKEYKVLADDAAYPGAHPDGVTDEWKWTTASGLKKELETLKAERETLEDKLAKLNTARDEAYNDAVNHQTYTPESGSASAHTAAENLDSAKAAYTAAYKAYVAAKQAYDQKKAEYDAADNLRIFINLADVVTEGGVAQKWQIVPVGTEDKIEGKYAEDTATFYYTSILPGGQTSAKLIDSVELDEKATQDMYKSFDFDLNVALDSRQIAYTQADPSVIETKQLEGFGATVTFDNNKDENTVLTWTQATATTDPSVGDAVATTYNASIIKSGAYTTVTVTKGTQVNDSNGKGYVYTFVDGTKTYAGNSTAAGTVYKELNSTHTDFEEDGGTYTLTQDAVKITT